MARRHFWRRTAPTEGENMNRKAFAAGALLLLAMSHASAAGCRPDDLLRPHQECPIHDTAASLKVNADAELCELPSLPGEGCAQDGWITSNGIINGSAYQYEARSTRKGWEIVSISPEPPNRNQWPRTVGSIGSRTITQGDTITLDASALFEDPDGDDLAFEVDHSFDFSDYEVEIGDSTAAITVESVGKGKFTLRAWDPGGLFQTLDMIVEVLPRRDPVAHFIPLFLSSWNTGREGFVRIINKSGVKGEVVIEARDDEGAQYDALSINLPARNSIHFNSSDLEDGNAGKGIGRGIGRGQGDWSLYVSSTLDLDVLVYVRTDDGFVTSLHDVVVADHNGSHRVVFFNPGSNHRQVSKLRVVNLGSETATVKVRGLDDKGVESADTAVFEVPAGGARSLSAHDLESGTGTDGGLDYARASGSSP